MKYLNRGAEPASNFDDETYKVALFLKLFLNFLLKQNELLLHIALMLYSNNFL